MKNWIIIIILFGVLINSCTKSENENKDKNLEKIVGVYCGNNNMSDQGPNYNSSHQIPSSIRISLNPKYDLELLMVVHGPLLSSNTVVGLNVEDGIVSVPLQKDSTLYVGSFTSEATGIIEDGKIIFNGTMGKVKDLVLFKDKDFDISGVYINSNSVLEITENDGLFRLKMDLETKTINEHSKMKGVVTTSDICDCGIKFESDNFYNEAEDSVHVVQGGIYFNPDSLRLKWYGAEISFQDIGLNGLVLKKE